MPFHPRFLNSMDRFSTMAPILFYIDGMKEAHEKMKGTEESSGQRGLQGPESIGRSITDESITLLIDVEDRALVPHSAEIDYLDPRRPLVMVIPAQPLRHGAHFAVVVHNATDGDGDRLPQSRGMKSALNAVRGTSTHERYADAVLPALRTAAPWTDFARDPESVQLLFDFVTVSEESQLGRIRASRDIALEHVSGPDWDWRDHVELVSETKHDCDLPDSFIARTYHVDMDVPFLLKERSRYSTLDANVFATGKPASVQKAKVLIQVPCSVERAASGEDYCYPVRTIMEFGHGLFHHRGEVRDGFLSRWVFDSP